MSQVKKFGEVFTPKHIVDKLLDGIDYSNPDLTICEPSFGDGRILLEVKTRLLEYHSEAVSYTHLTLPTKRIV